MNVQNATLINMNNIGIVSNDGEMEWKSPFNQYIFKIKRHEPNPSIGMTNYRIEIDIINNLNVFITKLVFNELDCVRILDSMNWLLNDTDYQSYSNIYIGTSTEPNLDYKIIFLQIVPLASDDVYLDNKTRQIIILSGPNMVGKSALLRQVALITILAQMGAYVPASKAQIGIVDKVCEYDCSLLVRGVFISIHAEQLSFLVPSLL